MRLHWQEVIQTGNPLLDTGITDLQVTVIDGVIHLFASTGRNGGLAGYTIGGEGGVTLATTVIYPPWMTATVGDRIFFAGDPEDPMLLVGAGPDGIQAYRITTDGALGEPVDLDWQILNEAVSEGAIEIAQAMIALSATAPDPFPQGFDCTQVVELVSVAFGGTGFVLAACGSRDGITTYAVDPATGALVEVASMGAAQGVGIAAPTAMEVVQVGGQTFAVLAAAGTSSLTLMQVLPDGSLMPTDHVLDNGTTRFQGVQSLASAVSGDHAFVVAGGADNGISLFLVLPDGKLLHLQTLADGATTSMHRVTAISAVVSGDELLVFVGSQNDAGVTRFAIDLSSLGLMVQGTDAAELLSGGAGDDILIAVGGGDTLTGGAGADVLVTGGDQTRMTGGDGADLFVIRQGSGTTHVLDFQRGVDRLDLSDLPMLRDLSQLAVTTTASGAIVEYRGHVIAITAANGQPLTRADLFPGGLEGGDHVPYIPPEDPNRGIEFAGTGGHDHFTGTDLNDTLFGGAGRDTLFGGSGDDWIDGGLHNDWIDGGDGADTLFGGGGEDVIYGGAGNDWIDGGSKKDTLIGGDGNDTIYGGGGRDRIEGGRGHDLLHGGKGSDTILGGEGSDLIHGEGGADRLRGGGGNDAIWGGDGNDRIYGENGNDWLSGGPGNDLIDGGPGNDTLRGGPGTDQMFGGEGADVFEFFGDHELNRIGDFNVAEGDILRLGEGMWASEGAMTAQELVDRFGVMTRKGNFVLDFAEIGGCVIVLQQFDDIEGLIGAIEFM